jgi:hypothetical protein
MLWNILYKHHSICRLSQILKISILFIKWCLNENYTIMNIINIYFYETSTQTSNACAPSHLLDTLFDILDKCLRFSLIKMESVSINPSHAWFSFCLYTFRLKMLLLVLIKNCNSFVYLIWILSKKLDLNQETSFYYRISK